MADENVSFKVDFNTEGAIGSARAFAAELKRIMDTASDTGHKATESLAGIETGLHHVKDIALETAAAFAGITAATFTVGAALEAIKAGIEKADFLRDLHASIDALSGGAEAGEKAFARLEKAAEKTRATGDELVQLYGRVLPLAIDRGFSQEGAQRFVSQIAKAAPAIGMSVEQAIDQSMQILAGRVRKTNLLAHVLGLDPESYTKGLQGLETVFPKLDELAAKGEVIGQTFESAGEKIKDSMLKAFAEGFTEARQATGDGLDGMIKAFQDPELIGSIHDIGKAIAELAPIVTKFVAASALELGKLADIFVNIGKGQFSGVGSFLEEQGAAINKDAAKWIRGLGSMQLDPISRAGFDAVADALDKLAAKSAPATLGIGDFLKAEHDAAKGGEEWSDVITGTGEHLKKVRDDANQTGSAIAVSIATVKEARVAFDKLFAKPETDPLSKQLQEFDSSVVALRVKFENEIAKMSAAAQKNPGAAPQINRDIDAMRKMLAVFGEVQVQGEGFITSNAFKKAFDDLQKSILAADNSLEEFAQSSGRKFSTGAGITGYGEALAEEIRSIKTEMDKALSATQTVLPFALKPEDIVAIKKQYEDLGKDLVKETDKFSQLMGHQLDEAIKSVFDNVRTGLSGVTDFAALFKQIEDAGKAQAQTFKDNNPFPISLADAIEQVQPKLDEAFRDAARKSGEELRLAIQNLSGAVTDLFTGALEGGAVGFAQTAATLFSKQVKDTAGKLFSDLAINVFGGQQTVPANATPEQASAISTQNAKNAAAAQGALNLIALFSQLGAASSGVNNPRQNPVGNVLGAGITGLSAGASIGAATSLGASAGGIIGAIVGLIIGGLMLALAPAVGKDYPYGRGTYIAGGTSTFEANGNVSVNESRDALAKLRTQGDSLWNGYVKILMELYKDGMDDVMKEISRSFDPKYGLDLGGDIGRAASKDFWTQWTNWIAEGLPKQFEAKFFDPIAKGVDKLGVSAEQFKGIWDSLAQLDPKAFQASILAFVQAMGQFAKGREFLGKSGPQLLDVGYKENNRTFIDDLKEGYDQILAFGEGVKNMVGEEQIQGLHDLAAAEAQQIENTKAFLKAIAQAIEQTTQSYQSAIRELQLEGVKGPDGKPDIQGQVNFLKNYADQLLAQIKNASSPEQALQLSTELQNVILRIKGLGGQLGPEAAEAYRKWAITNLQIAQDAVTDKLKAFADSVAAQNQAFLDAIDKLVQAILDAAANINSAGAGGGDDTSHDPAHNPGGGGIPGGDRDAGDGTGGRGGRGQGYRGPRGGETPTDGWGFNGGQGEEYPGGYIWRPPDWKWPWQHTPPPPDYPRIPFGPGHYDQTQIASPRPPYSGGGRDFDNVQAPPAAATLDTRDTRAHTWQPETRTLPAQVERQTLEVYRSPAANNDLSEFQRVMFDLLGRDKPLKLETDNRELHGITERIPAADATHTLEDFQRTLLDVLDRAPRQVERDTQRAADPAHDPSDSMRELVLYTRQQMEVARQAHPDTPRLDVDVAKQNGEQAAQDAETLRKAIDDLRSDLAKWKQQPVPVDVHGVLEVTIDGQSVSDVDLQDDSAAFADRTVNRRLNAT